MADANKTIPEDLSDFFNFPSESNATKKPLPGKSLKDLFDFDSVDQEHLRKEALKKKILEELRMQRQAMNFPEDVRKGRLKPSLPPSVYYDETFKK